MLEMQKIKKLFSNAINVAFSKHELEVVFVLI